MTSLRVLEPGLLTIVQDLGRPGYLRYGIPPSGPVDREAFILANRLVGNPDSAAGLECTLIGLRLEVDAAGVVAVTGAEMPVTVNEQDVLRWTAVRLKAGDVLRLGQALRGVRAYLAVSGGIDVPAVLGSHSTYLRGQLGGLEGRQLQKGDLLRLGRPEVSLEAVEGRQVRTECIRAYSEEPEVRVILGPQADRFTDAGIAAFLEGPYEMLPQSDRMGSRLRGPHITHTRGHDIVSDGVPLGGIQVIGDGQPIVLLVDRQSTGGYTKIATVCSFDIAKVGQVRPGQRLKFRSVSVDEAHATLRVERACLDGAIVK